MRMGGWSGWTIILFWGSIMAASVAVQLVPIVGLISLMLLSPFWFGGALHAMMISLGAQALRRRIGAAWLALPLLYYGGGFGLHLASVERAEAQAAAIEAANAKISIQVPRPFVYAAEDRMAVGDTQLVERYHADRAFLVGKDHVTTRYFAKGRACDTANTGWWYEKRFEPFLHRRDLFPAYKGADKTRQCLISQDGLPAVWRYRIIREESLRRGDWMNQRFGTDFTVIDDRAGKTVLQVETASIRTLPPILTLVAGCTIAGSGAPRTCEILPWGSSRLVPAGYKPRTDKGNPFTPTVDPAHSEVAALAKALGLEPRLPTD
jgi:hypothetical protein